jgi:hypothetical protein
MKFIHSLSPDQRHRIPCLSADSIQRSGVIRNASGSEPLVLGADPGFSKLWVSSNQSRTLACEAGNEGANPFTHPISAFSKAGMRQCKSVNVLHASLCQCRATMLKTSWMGMRVPREAPFAPLRQCRAVALKTQRLGMRIPRGVYAAVRQCRANSLRNCWMVVRVHSAASIFGGEL